VWKSFKKVIKLLSLECRKVIGFVLPRFPIGLKNSRHFFIQSEIIRS